MKIIEEVLNEPAANSILKHNINPLRVGLMLYRVIDSIENLYGYSPNTSALMKDMLSEQIRKTLEMYNEPDEFLFQVE